MNNYFAPQGMPPNAPQNAPPNQQPGYAQQPGHAQGGAQNQQLGYTSPPQTGLKPFVPQKLTGGNQPFVSIHPSVTGTGLVGTLAVLGWLVVLVAPFVALFNFAKEFAKLLPNAMAQTTGAAAEAAQQFIEGAGFNYEDAFSGAISTWKLVGALFKAVGGSVSMQVLGFFLVGIAFILLFINLVNMRARHMAARILLIVNLLFCTGSALVFYLALSRVSGKIQVFIGQGLKSPSIMLFAMFITAGLWLIAAIIYFILAAKSTRIYQDNARGVCY